MKEYTSKEFINIIKKNGFFYHRSKGSHFIYKNNKGDHISIPYKLSMVIARRLIKENNINLNVK